MTKRTIPWLDAYAEKIKAQQEASKNNAKTASAKKTNKIEASKIEATKKIILKKDGLEKAVNGETVKYRNFIWKIINASYKDAHGPGVVLEKVSAISEKKLTDPQDYARTDPGDVYDYEVRDSYEVPELQETAAQTEVSIAQENAVDRTTPAGRATNPYKAEENIFSEVVEESIEEAKEEVAEEPAVEEAQPEATEEPAKEVAEEATEEVKAEAEETEVPAEHDMEDDFKKEIIEDVKTACVEDKKVEASAETPKKRKNPIIASIVGEGKRKTNRIITNIVK